MITFRLHPFIRFCLASFAACPLAIAATFHVDPATGNMGNPGTVTQPWSTLEAVFAANKTFAAGDVILLRSGYHGAPTVKGNNSGVVTIRPDTNATPKLKGLIVRSAARWDLSGLDICPENAAAGVYNGGTLVEIESSCSNITLRNSSVRGAFSNSGWSGTDWDARVGRSIRTAAPGTTLSNNFIGTSGFGLVVRKTATNTLVSRNHFKAFYLDGIQALADDCLFEYNRIEDSYVADTNHDDFFQSWSTDTAGTVGAGTIYRVTLRGNIFISRMDSAQPLATDPQGIGCFDGVFEGWVIENNLIVSNTYHGIALYGAKDCRIVNNTVVENPFNTTTGKKPWIRIYPHKNGTASSGNLIRNNISADAASYQTSSGGTLDHNQKTTAYPTYFTNPGAFDFSLRPTAPAVGAGEAANAPVIDIRERPRSVPYDLGAHEYFGDAYRQWLEANGLPADGSGNGARDANPSGDGVSNAFKFALGLPVNSAGYAGRLVTGTIPMAGQNYLSLTYIRPDPAPAGTGYVVKASGDLITWSSAPIVEVSNTLAGGLRTITLRDTVPIRGGMSGRFIRLEVTVP